MFVLNLAFWDATNWFLEGPKPRKPWYLLGKTTLFAKSAMSRNNRFSIDFRYPKYTKNHEKAPPRSKRFSTSFLDRHFIDFWPNLGSQKTSIFWKMELRWLPSARRYFRKAFWIDFASPGGQNDSILELPGGSKLDNWVYKSRYDESTPALCRKRCLSGAQASLHQISKTESLKQITSRNLPWWLGRRGADQ